MPSARHSQFTVDDYIAQFPESTQLLLAQLRTLIQTTAPTTVESISYEIPTYKIDGHPFIYFSAYEHHIGVYPAQPDIKELEAYRHGKGTYRFPLDQPLPLNHLRRLLTYRLHTLRAAEK